MMATKFKPLALVKCEHFVFLFIGGGMQLTLIRVKIKCIDDKPHVIVFETGEELEVAFGNFEDGIFVKYQDEEYLIDTDYPCWAGGDGVLRLQGTPQQECW